MLLSVLPSLSAPVASSDHISLFAAWKGAHGKSYDTGLAEAKAFEAFVGAETRINAHNAKNLSWTEGHNEWSDLTPDEFQSMFWGYNPDAAKEDTLPVQEHEVQAGEAQVSSIDWTKKGAVTKVKKQICGTCWAFSTTGAIEGQLGIQGHLTSLSEQELASCFKKNGCNGGFPDDAMKWVANNGGIVSEKEYPFVGNGNQPKGTIEKCKPAKEKNPVATVKGVTKVTSEKALLSAVQGQPVSVDISASFQHYKSGVLDDKACTASAIDHAVLVVGFGDQGNKPYWKVKNSWGTNFGEDGYIRIVRNKGMCHIGKEGFYPTGVKYIGGKGAEDMTAAVEVD
jgi:C1A family cysteine protease